MTEFQPGGYLDGIDTLGTVGGTPEGNDTVNDVFSSIDLVAGDDGINYNFGELIPATISGTVFNDNNNDGIQNGADAGIPGVTVTLTGTNDLGTITPIVVMTDGSGNYSFENLRPGEYIVTETQPATHLDGIDTLGTIGGTPEGNDTVNDVFSAITINSDDDGINYDFAEILPSTISGRVFNDINNDGIQNGADAGIAGVLITLTGTDDLGNAVNLTDTTDGNGDYSFADLRPGQYTITETQPATHLDGIDTVGTVNGLTEGVNSSNDVFSQIDLTPDDTGLNYNFAEILPASIAGTVYEDLNNNGIQDGGELGIPGATVTLSGTNDLGAITPIVVMTDGNGDYLFDNLRPGEYTVTETQPAGYLDGLDSPGTVNGIPDGTNSANDVISAITLTTDDTAVEYNFGELPPSSISGTVFDDLNNDGIQNGAEVGIQGVTIFLSGTDDLGAVNLVATTDINGDYSFDNLRPGEYTVTEVQPIAYLDGIDSLGTVGGVPEGDDSVNDVFSSINLGTDDDGIEYNFGELQPASITGVVYHDANNNGAQDGGEFGIQNVFVTLTGTNDLGSIGSIVVQTDINGIFTFDNLRPGEYTITESQPSDYLDGIDTLGTVDGTPEGNAAVNDVFSSVDLMAGDDGINYLFGELLPNSISGTVFSDLNNNGIQDGGEMGIPGVTVTLTGTDDMGAISPIIVTTNPLGEYIFEDLRPGTYTVTETQPGGYLDGIDTVGSLGGNDTVNDVFSNIVVLTDDEGINYNFGEVLPSTISGTVFNDENNDGIQNGADAGIPGVTVTLTGTDDLGNAVNLTDTTDGNGDYSFTDLRPGEYTLTETQPASHLDGIDTLGTVNGLTDGNDTVNDVFSEITLTPDDTGLDYDFAEILASTISGTVFNDENNDGIQNGADAGIAGVLITLTGTDDLGNAVNLTDTTDGNGDYSFTDLRPGEYTLTETQPASHLDGIDTLGTVNGLTDGNDTVNDVFSEITLTPDDTGLDYDFAEILASTISGTVYEDLNNNGIQDGGELGIPGVTVTLTGTNDLGVITPIVVMTDGNGDYLFDNLRPGEYVITETQAAGYLDGLDTPGTVNGIPDGTNSANDVISAVTLTPDDTAVEYNFGELPPSSITGTVFNDLNNNGIQDGGELGIPGVTVTLTGTNDLGTITPIVIMTDGNGDYLFDNLRPGEYTVTETQPASHLDGIDTLGTVGGTPNGNDTVNDVFSEIMLGTDDDGIEYNFAEILASTISGTVFNDENNDGIQNGADAGIAGVLITLTGTDDLGNAVNLTDTTDGNGDYSFTDLRPGEYTLTETQPASHLDGIDTLGTVNGLTDGNDTINDVFSEITLTPDDTGIDYDFAEILASTISGTVFNDENNDGIQNGADAGIAGVLITLTGTDDLGNAVNLTDTTDGNGDYSFTDLRPGEYTLTETQPASHLDGIDTLGTVNGLTEGNDTVNDVFSEITLTPDDTGLDYDFAEILASTISGTVFNDENNDGIQNGADAGIAGVLITLTGTDDLGNAVNLTDTTDGNGDYSFTDLRPGEYTLTETQPASHLDGIDTLGTVNGLTDGNDTVNDVFSEITLTPDDTGLDYDFAEILASTISGTVFNDDNNDGIQNGADAGIAGVTVTLTGTDDLGNAVNLTDTTDGNGDYSFTDLRPGEYTLTETQPASHLDGIDTLGTVNGLTDGNDTVNDVFSEITLTPDDTGLDYDFAEILASTISGTVFNDENNDGIQNGADAGIAGVLITLTGTDDLGNAVNLTDTTDGNGDYSFTDLRPGEYTLTETQPASHLDGIDTLGTVNGLTDGNDTVNDVFSEITLTPDDTGLDYDFAEILASTISGTVFEDDNNDGIQNGPDAGIAGVLITLTGTDDLGNAVNLTDTTDANGDYSFTNLRPGEYTLTETQPPVYLDGIDTLGTVNGLTEGSYTVNDVFAEITLTPDDTGLDYDFAEILPSSLSGTVFDDLNNNGVQDGGELGIPGVTVTLTGTDDLGAVSQTILTDANGNYSFTDLRPGEYTVTETQATGYLDGIDTLGTVGGTPNGNDTVNDEFSAVMLGTGDDGIDYDFAELQPASISGTVFDDLNNNGIQDGGELGIPGVTVTLTGTNDFGTITPIVLMTDANGNYIFENLRPGDYTVTETQPAGYLDGIDTVGSEGGIGTVNDVTSAISISAGEDGVNYNFAELQPASISGTVFDDTNNDGIQNGGEIGIPGVTVTLTGTNDFGTITPIVLMTDANGNHIFEDLRPGDYTVTETQPAGYLDGIDTVGSEGGNGTVNDVTSDISIVAGEDGVNYNFAELQPASLAGTVFDDLNNNGIQDGGEPGIPGVTVTLTGINDFGTITPQVLTTDANGNYIFENLRPGTYVVTEDQPSGYLDGIDTVGSEGGDGTVNDVTSGIPIETGDTAVEYNFAELRPSSISGTVYLDVNNNQTQDPTEPGLGGVEVTLTGTDDLGNPVNTTIITNPDGTYTFDELRPGTYTVTETQPTGLLDGEENVGTAGGNLLPPDTINTITLVPDTQGIEYDFAELPPSSLAGTVFDDLDNDGIQDPGEPGLEGVTITLIGTDDRGNPVQLQVQTDADGNYLFENLRPGEYILLEAQPDGFLDGIDTIGSIGGTLFDDEVRLTIVPGQDGVEYNFGELQPASLSGQVYEDRINNGVFDPIDNPIAGVTITLMGTDDRGTLVHLTTTTDSNGNYLFENLRPGTYSITETQPVGFLDGKDQLGSLGGQYNVNDRFDGIVLTPGDNGTDYDFADLLPNLISGTVYQDFNTNGIQDAGEPGISGVTLNLTGIDDLGNNVTLTTVTDADGNYLFQDLRLGTYAVTEIQPTDFVDGLETPGTLGGVVVGDNTIAQIVLTIDDSRSFENNFGELGALTPIPNPLPAPTPPTDITIPSPVPDPEGRPEEFIPYYARDTGPRPDFYSSQQEFLVAYQISSPNGRNLRMVMTSDTNKIMAAVVRIEGSELPDGFYRVQVIRGGNDVLEFEKGRPLLVVYKLDQEGGREIRRVLQLPSNRPLDAVDELLGSGEYDPGWYRIRVLAQGDEVVEMEKGSIGEVRLIAERLRSQAGTPIEEILDWNSNDIEQAVSYIMGAQDLPPGYYRVRVVEGGNAERTFFKPGVGEEGTVDPDKQQSSKGAPVPANKGANLGTPRDEVFSELGKSSSNQVKEVSLEEFSISVLGIGVATAFATNRTRNAWKSEVDAFMEKAPWDDIRWN
ncbi:Hypothetical protein PBC10988_0920 [Planctomycetales bacterium 10988]|nr:Hypothetical protein PBC10988_0920 [Planctomycetales bacterium 10988]